MHTCTNLHFLLKLLHLGFSARIKVPLLGREIKLLERHGAAQLLHVHSIAQRLQRVAVLAHG
jgi:hypothetical protein